MPLENPRNHEGGSKDPNEAPLARKDSEWILHALNGIRAQIIQLDDRMNERLNQLEKRMRIVERSIYIAIGGGAALIFIFGLVQIFLSYFDVVPKS